jgi:hypothetical protein
MLSAHFLGRIATKNFCSEFIICSFLIVLVRSPNRAELSVVHNTQKLCLAQHRSSKTKVDADEDGVGGDDAADCLRYLVGTKARELVVRRLTGW